MVGPLIMRIGFATTGNVDCQYLSDTYAIVADVTFGYAPPAVQTLWQAAGCNTSPYLYPNNATNMCQIASDLYGIQAGITFGYAPPAVQTWWASQPACNNSRTIKPMLTENACQRASDTYGIFVDQTTGATTVWGTAPSTVQTWWTTTGCAAQTQPTDINACQSMSDLYGAVAGKDFGWAPAAAQTWWGEHGCHTCRGRTEETPTSTAASS